MLKVAWRFIKTTVKGGVFFLMPLILTVFLLQKALQTVSKFVSPFARLIPFDSIAGVRTPYLLAAVILMAVGFIAGLLAQTRFGQYFKEHWERWLENHIPGYRDLKAKADQLTARNDIEEASKR